MSEYDQRLLRMADREETGFDLLSWLLLAGAGVMVILMFVALRLAN